MMHQIYPSPNHNYSYELHKDFQFAAAHFVPHPDAGECQYMHGHTYFVDITVAGDELNEQGFLINFQRIKELIAKRFDHKVLNDDPLFSTESAVDFPTSEVLARKIYELLQNYFDTCRNQPKCLQVFLRETPTSYCIYRPKAGGRL